MESICKKHSGAEARVPHQTAAVGPGVSLGDATVRPLTFVLSANDGGGHSRCRAEATLRTIERQLELEPEPELSAEAAARRAAPSAAAPPAAAAAAGGASPPGSVVLVREFGVVLLRGALGEREQKQLLSHVKSRCVAGKDFHVSSGKAGAAQHHTNEPLHALGEELFRRVASAVVAQLTPAQIESEPSFRRMGRAHTGEEPVVIYSVTGVAYGSRKLALHNHTDLDRPLYTMSLALGDACDFTVGCKTVRPHKNERSGKPVTLRMESGDAIFFDGGSVPHAVGPLHPGSGPGFWQKAKPPGVTRIGLLFREPL